MKFEIEVELPEHIVAEWDAVAVRRAKAGEWIAVPHGDGMVAMRCAIDAMTPAIILRKKLNPRDWWPQWITADRMTFFNDVILLTSNNAQSLRLQYDSSLIDLSRIPGHLRFSGRVIDNPWKKKVQR